MRVVGDYSIAGHNSGTSVAEKVDVGDVDVIVGIARCLLLAEPSSEFSLPLGDGGSCSVVVHPEWTAEGLRVKGRVRDLSKAHRLLARKPGTCELHCDCTWGQRQAVHGLVRAAGPRLRFKRIGAALLLGCPSVVARADDLGFVPWTHYVDDFPTLMFSDLCDDLELLVDGFFSALGLGIECLPPFAESFRPLGVEFTFPLAGHSRVGDWTRVSSDDVARPSWLLSVLSDSSSVGGRERSLRTFRVRGCCIPTARASL